MILLQSAGKDNPKTDKVFRNYVFTATEEGVHDLELHFGSRKVEIEEVPPTLGIFGSAYSMLSKVFV